MPLIKSTSKQAFGENVSREMHAGRPQKQALAIAYATKRAAAHKGGHHSGHSSEHTGESTITKRPSNTSSANPRSGKSFVESPMPHSSHAARRSEDYHKNTVTPTYVRPSSTKMTRAEHQLNNPEDMSEKGHKL